MRYLESENPYLIGRFSTGDTVTISVYDLSDDSSVVSGASMSEVGSTGFFKYGFNPSVSSLKEYLYVMTNGTEEHAGKIILGGYPDSLVDDTASLVSDVNNMLKIETGRWKITGNQLIFYDSDGTTPLYTFNLKDGSGSGTETNVLERVPV